MTVVLAPASWGFDEILLEIAARQAAASRKKQIMQCKKE